MLLLDLIQNIALLVALAAVYNVILLRLKRGSLVTQNLIGLLFGAASIIGMMTPVHLEPGIILDGRTIILSVAGLFGGPVAAAVAAGMSVIYRFSLGGVGAGVGISNILQSAALGVLLFYLRKNYVLKMNLPVLVGFGLAIHIIMLLFMLALPENAGSLVLQQIAVPVILLFPVATVLVCLLFLNTENQIRDRNALQESEKTLQKSEAFQKALIGSSPLGIIGLDLDGKVTSWNLAVEGISGWKASEVTGKPHPYVNPDQEAEFKKLLKFLTENENFSGMEVLRQKKNGENYTASLSAAPIHDRKGSIRGYVITAEDITDRKLAREALAQSEERFRNIVEGAPDAIFIQTDKKFAYLNRKALDLFGAKEASELIGKPVFDRFHPGFHLLINQRIHELNEKRMPVSPLEQIFLRLDSSQFWVETTGQPISYEGKSGALVFVRDISERKTAESLVEEQLSELRRWHSAMLGREKRILQLKGEVNELLQVTGKPERYEMAEPFHKNNGSSEKPPDGPDEMKHFPAPGTEKTG